MENIKIMLIRLKLKIDKLVNEMLDQLPQQVWLNPHVTFLDPAMGGGQFLKEVIRRLRAHGYSDENISSRVFGVAEDEIDLNYARKNAKLIGKYGTGGVDFDFERAFGLKKFDVIVGNPPYTEGTGKVNIYNHFVEKSLKIGEIILFVIPSAWMNTTNINLIKLRNMILPKLKSIKLNDKQLFVGAKVRTCWIFLTSHVEEKIDVYDFEEFYSIERDLFKNSEILLGGNKKKTEILIKIAKTSTPLLFKKTKNQRDTEYEDGDDIQILKQLSINGPIFVSKKKSKFDFTDFDKHRIAVGYLPSGEELGSPYLGTINYIPPGVIIPGYYRYIAFESKKEVENVVHYLNSDFVRWILQKTRTSQSLDGPQTRFVPKEDFVNYDYKSICKKFGFEE